MPVPEFVLRLREKIGHDELWMPGITALVFDRQREHLLVVRRADTGEWTPVTGIIDPGEEPARAGIREVAEEAGIEVRPIRMIQVHSTPPVVHANGDLARYLDLCFVFEHVSGEPHPADGENTQARWAPLADLPPMRTRFRDQVALALTDRADVDFRT
ncbi:MAG: NUDIX domain-containing protein [Brachybacterium sp.]|nr:NUDIX domain-containing protein [Brachybacterium sp.]